MKLSRMLQVLVAVLAFGIFASNVEASAVNHSSVKVVKTSSKHKHTSKHHKHHKKVSHKARA
jgi:hypothetical protein